MPPTPWILDNTGFFSTKLGDYVVWTFNSLGEQIAGVLLGCARVHSTCGAPQVVKTWNPTGNIMFAMLIMVIMISKMQLFCGLNQNNDPFWHLLLQVDAKMTLRYLSINGSSYILTLLDTQDFKNPSERIPGPEKWTHIGRHICTDQHNMRTHPGLRPRQLVVKSAKTIALLSFCRVIATRLGFLTRSIYTVPPLFRTRETNLQRGYFYPQLLAIASWAWSPRHSGAL